MFVLFLKKATYLMSPTIDPFLCLIRKTKFWKDLYLNTYIITYVITIYFFLYSLAFFLETQLSISYHSCTTCFAKLWIQAKKYRLSSVTSAKPLTVCGMLASLLNFMQLVSQETFMHGLQIICLTGNSELFSLALFLIGHTFVLEFPKDRS